MKNQFWKRGLRRSAVLLVAAAAVLMLAGCQKAQPDEPSSSDDSTQTQQTQQTQQPEVSAGAEGVKSDCVLENYSINVQVQGNHRLTVTETLTVNYKNQISGITRTIPYEGYRYDPSKNEAVQYRMNLDHIDVDEVDYSVKRESGKAYITIGAGEGDPAGGTHIYTLRYRLSYYKDADSENDWLDCDLLPYGWDSSISAANISVTMPKEFEGAGIQMYRYAGGEWRDADISYTASGKTISAYLRAEDIKANKELLMQIKLPEGYFKGEKTLIPIQIFGYGVLVLLTVGAIVLWWMFGRPLPALKTSTLKKHKLTAVEDAYLLRRTLSVTDVAALLTVWAESGMIQITQLSESDYTITALTALGQGAKNFECTLYDALFADGIKCRHIGDVSDIIRSVLPKMKRQTAKNCAAICGGRLLTLESSCVKYAAWLLSVVPTLILLLVGGYVMLDYSAGYVGVVSSIALAVTHGGILALRSCWKNLQKLSRLLFSVICALAEIVVLGGVVYFASSSLGLGWQVAMAVIAALLTLFVSLFSCRNSEGYRMQLSQLMSYKRYLRQPEQIEGDFSAFYYSRLPQAYVLRVGKVFSKNCNTMPLAPSDGLILLGDTEKLSRTTGYYPAYLHFISTAYYAQSESEQEEQSKSATTSKQKEKPESGEKPAGVIGVLKAAFQKAAFWCNEAIDWIEVKIERIRYKLSAKKQKTQDSDEEDAE